MVMALLKKLKAKNTHALDRMGIFGFQSGFWHAAASGTHLITEKDFMGNNILGQSKFDCELMSYTTQQAGKALKAEKTVRSNLNYYR